MENFAKWLTSFTQDTKGKVVTYVFTERVITGLSRLLDGWMIYLISQDVQYGIYKAFFYVTPFYALLCISAVYVSDYFLAKGSDITGMEELRKIECTQYKRSQFFKRFLKWILSRKNTIFWIGSWCSIDPTYVTLLLRRSSKEFWRNSLLITIPSVTLSMLVHTGIWWCAVKGFGWAVWYVS